MNISSFLRKNVYSIVFVVLILVLFLTRVIPFVLYGPFGFGYDTGIYKYIFERIVSLKDVFASEIYFLPSSIALIFNKLGLPMDWFLYYGHVLFSTFVAVPLYLLTKRYFGRVAGLLAILIFTISYVQLFASEFYLFKAEIGAIFMLFSFYFYSKKSYWFYLFALLLGLTQLPQFVILIVATGIAGLVNFKKDLRYNLIGFSVFALSFGVLALFTPHHLVNAFNVVWGALSGAQTYDAHQTGLFIEVPEFLYKSWLFLILGAFGVFKAFRMKNILSLNVAVLFLAVVVFGGIVFQNRFIVDLDLLMIPFVSYALVYIYYRYIKSRVGKALSLAALVFVGAFYVFYYLLTTFPAISDAERWAIEVINEREDSNYLLVTDSSYAPWMQGFSDKVILAPGMFESVWNYEEFSEYNSASVDRRVEMLLDISGKYGNYYLFKGFKGPPSSFDEQTSSINKIFDLNGVVVYEVFEVN